MTAFDRIKSGIPGLDKALDNIRLGDNVVWNVTNLNEFSYFVDPYVKQAKEDNRNLIYIRFANHPPLVEMTKEDFKLLENEQNNQSTEFCMIERDGIKIYYVNPYNQFETFTLEVHKIIEKEGFDAFYVFDCLSDLQAVWSTDLMMGNFFKVTCPFLFQLDTVAFFPIIRGRHSYDAIAKIRETTQLFLNVYSKSPEEVYVSPLKVWNRYSQTMFLGHKFNPTTGSVKVLQDGHEVSRYYKIINDSDKFQNGQTLDSWERYMLHVRMKYAEGKNIDDECDKLCELMMTKDEKMLSKIKEYFTFEDYLTIYDRRVGSGLVGGKSCGMLLARKIIEKNCPEIYNNNLEPDDSFYIGSDLFYTYIVSNDLWDLRVKQRTEEGYYEYGKKLEEGLKKGTFSDEIKKEFVHILDYFGQNPIIVRSSSFLEDGYGNAFAGKYESVFCVNRGTLEERLVAFEDAVKIVYSSTMNISALEYRKLNGLDDTDEQMALLVQRVSGSYHGDYLFPTAAGVGFSYSPYSPLPDMDNSKGMLRLVMGLGTKAVDRTKKDYPRIVNLDKPEVTMMKDIKDKHRYSQHYLDVIDLKNRSLHDIPVDEGLKIIPRYSKKVLGEHDREAERMFRERGQRREIVFVNCEGLVKNQDFIKQMKEILNTLETAYDYPVDIEYTVNVGNDNSFNINLLQCRPLQVSTNDEDIEMPEDKNIKESSMGMSRKNKIDTICYVDPHKYYEYPYAQKSSLSRVISEVNAYCKDNDKTAILIVPGRIGTSSPELGIPVVFADISHFSAILEESYSEVGYMPELSFGSHMFQDLVEAEIYYGAIFENEKKIEFNKDMIFDYDNILSDINPNLDDELYEMVHVIDFEEDKAELYHDMNKDETMCIFNS